MEGKGERTPSTKHCLCGKLDVVGSEGLPLRVACVLHGSLGNLTSEVLKNVCKNLHGLVYPYKYFSLFAR